jgi:hypothetical protein
MCRWGDTVTIEVEGRRFAVDRCIADLVRGLNLAGVRTVASCCGHGRRPGSIILADGREFIIAPDYETARKVEWAFDPLAQDQTERRRLSFEACSGLTLEALRHGWFTIND